MILSSLRPRLIVVLLEAHQPNFLRSHQFISEPIGITTPLMIFFWKHKLDSRGQPEFSCSLPARCLASQFHEQPLPSSLPMCSPAHLQTTIPSIDLNAPDRSQGSTGFNDDCLSSKETGKLIQVGNMVGFHINEDNMDILEGISSKACEGACGTNSHQ